MPGRPREDPVLSVPPGRVENGGRPRALGSAVVVQGDIVLALAGVVPVGFLPVPSELEADAGLGQVVDTAVGRAPGDAVAVAADVHPVQLDAVVRGALVDVDGH